MKFGRVGLALLTAAALVAGVLPPKALADSNARIVRLSYVDGEAQIDRRDGRGFEHAFLNMPLGPGTRVSTRDDARAEIEFEDMSTVRLTPGTLVETQSLDLRSSGAKYTLVDLQDGTAYFNIRKRDDDNDFRVTTGRREFSLTRAARFRLRVDRSQVVLAVFAGEIEVVGEGGHLTVRKNETLTLDLDDPARYFLAKGVSSDRYDDWDQERDEYRDRYANVGNYRGYSSAYSYGVSDLNYWGSYTNISGYGYMWRPNYYGVNWNPYANGAWYWYPGYGYIWVSAYPWGWMPFRYGNWYYIGGHGWCWRPGNQWHHWSPVVAVHNPPPGHLMPTPPPPTGRRDPVVVGHGPATILPPEDLGPRRGVRDPNVLGK
ncbi:MAG TPA: FecR family protein, partial [Terriglobales bacterium]|nr:FecR family protein [Terriglobales bacterium]